MELRPVSGALGAEVRGVDVRAIDAATAAAVRDALHEHQVLFFVGACLSGDEQLAFAGGYDHCFCLDGAGGDAPGSLSRGEVPRGEAPRRDGLALAGEVRDPASGRALEVWTDGTINPVDAVSNAAEILADQFALFSRLGRPQPTMVGRGLGSGPTLSPGARRIRLLDHGGRQDDRPRRRVTRGRGRLTGRRLSRLVGRHCGPIRRLGVPIRDVRARGPVRGRRLVDVGVANQRLRLRAAREERGPGTSEAGGRSQGDLSRSGGGGRGIPELFLALSGFWANMSVACSCCAPPAAGEPPLRAGLRSGC